VETAGRLDHRGKRLPTNPTTASVAATAAAPLVPGPDPRRRTHRLEQERRVGAYAAAAVTTATATTAATATAAAAARRSRRCCPACKGGGVRRRRAVPATARFSGSSGGGSCSIKGQGVGRHAESEAVQQVQGQGGSVPGDTRAPTPPRMCNARRVMRYWNARKRKGMRLHTQADWRNRQ